MLFRQHDRGMTRHAATLAGFAVVVLWASAFPAIRVAVPEFGAVGLSFVRLAVAAIALIVVGLIMRIRLPRLADLGWVAACGLTGMAAYQLLLNWGELHVPAGTASIIVSAAPLVSVLVARVLFAERVPVIVGVGSLVALAGVTVVCLARSGIGFGAAAWVVVAAMVVQGIYHPLQKPLLRKYSSIEVATYCMLAGVVMTLPFVPVGWAMIVHAGPAGWLSAAYLGLLPSALGFVLWAFAVARMPVALSTSLLYLVPPVAVLISWIWLGEVPLVQEAVGGVIVLLGVALVSQGERLRRALGRPKTENVMVSFPE
ncbi:DMT family transporter [Curtobacterium sp. USHLN213]|uniref:DMT family transporter n=1 Tax=Curtobacterium sp. USHLN213 TaxID=3081255 RepID=UPI00301A877F